jgi:hypothetical protein
MRQPKPIQCRWCLATFATEELRKAHTAAAYAPEMVELECPVKSAVQKAERQSGRELRWEKIAIVRDRAPERTCYGSRIADVKKTQSFERARAVDEQGANDMMQTTVTAANFGDRLFLRFRYATDIV